jgi:hypothetical protein
MRISVQSKKHSIREFYLNQEQKIFLEKYKFNKIKDWDDKGPDVIWEGEIYHELLKNRYKIKIEYGSNYPFVRPKVYPIEPLIRNQRHQNPTQKSSNDPGDLCLFPVTPDYWRVGIQCDDIITRTIKWLEKYEAGTLDSELAPPEIERYFPSENKVSKPIVILPESLLNISSSDNGRCVLVHTKSGDYAFLSVIQNENEENYVLETIVELHKLILSRDPLDEKKKEGLWFHVDMEPRLPVPTSFSELARFIAEHTYGNAKNIKMIAEEFISISPGIVAVWYNTGYYGPHWLVFQINKVNIPPENGFRPQRFYEKILIANNNNKVMI